MPTAPGDRTASDQHHRDRDLVARSGRGDTDALQELYRRYRDGLLTKAVALVHDLQQAEDIVQDVMVQLWQSPHRYDPSRGTVASFLLLQCHGRAIDLSRADAARRRRQRLAAGVGVTAGDPVAEVTVEGLRAAKLVTILDRLPENEAQVIRLAFFGEQTYRQVADALGVPEGTVKSRIRAGLRRLKLLLDE